MPTTAKQARVRAGGRRPATSVRKTRPTTHTDMQTYIKYKALDLIGNGSYCTYVRSCEKNAEPWAQDIIRAVNEVQNSVRAMHALVADLQQTNKMGLHTLCQTVIENNTPPIEQHTVIAECSVSGKPKCHCIVLKCKGRGAPHIMVQGRFSHFVLMLWAVFKIDIIIKTVARDYIKTAQAQRPRARHALTMRELSDGFLEDTATIEKLAVGIVHALDHVRLSLEHELRA